MLISLRHRLVVFAMPKCASTAVERAVAPDMDIVINGAPELTHTIYRKYHRHLRPYLATYTDQPFETVCLFREPLDWFNSWWRYRQRPDIPNPANSTRGMTFDAFVNASLDDTPGPAKLGRQARFVSARDGSIGIGHIFRYESIGAYLGFLSERTGRTYVLEHLNVSPPGSGAEVLSAATRARAERELSDDYRIYRDIAR